MTYNIKEKTNFTIFDGPESYVNYLARVPSEYCTDDRYSEFYGAGREVSLNTLTNGSLEYIDQAQRLIDQMVDANVFASHQPQIEAGMVGFMANVPNALAGQPYDMWRIAETEEESITTPINVYVETLVSGGITHQELIQRGVCVLAFVLAMNNIRPVELYTICIGKPSGGKTAGIVCRVPSKPLDIARAGFMLCDPAYYRRLAFAAMCEHSQRDYNGSIAWPWHDEPTTNTHEPKMRELLDMTPDDVFIPGGYLFDELMKHNPIQWVKNKIKEHQGSKQGEGGE